MTRNNGVLNAAEAIAKKQIMKAAHIARAQTLDKMFIALGQLGMSPDDLAMIEDEFYQVEQDFCEELLKDSEHDHSLTYAKDKIDRVLQQYVREDRFHSYDERYIQ